LPSDFSSGDLDTVTPLLYDSGAGGLGWWRIRDTELSETPSGDLLHQAFRLLTLQSRIEETKIAKVFRLLRAANIEPILIKGWAVARSYPQLGLRPCGDIDLLIRPEKHSEAARLAASEELRDCFIDLHYRSFELADRSLDDLFSRSRLVRCGDKEARVLCDEDQFALLAIHLLKHGAWRPLWLCDLALMLESMASNFDWDLCMGKDTRRKNWILSALGLAHELLDASVKDEQISEHAIAPRWLVQTVQENWRIPFATMHEGLRRLPVKSYLRRPDNLLTDLVRRWPNPIRATIDVNGTFTSRHPIRYQIQDCLKRAGGVLQSTTEST